MLNLFAFYLLCFIIWFIPIPFGSNRAWAWSLIELLICMNTILACISSDFRKQLPILKNLKIIFGMLFIVQFLVFLQWFGAKYTQSFLFSSLDPSQTEISLIKGLTYCLFIINLVLVLNDSRRVKVLCWMIIFSGLTQALYAIFLQYSGWRESLFGFDIGPRATGSFIYQNHLASYLFLCLSIAIGYLIGSLEGIVATSKKQKLAAIIDTLLSTKWVVRISIIIMVVALILTRSRMGNTAFFISLLFTSIFSLYFMKRPPNTLKWLVISLVALDMIIVGSYFGVEKIKERLEITSFQSETRDEVVQDAIPYMEDYWLTGSGAGSFYSTFVQYQNSEYKNFYDHAHNEYVQFIVEFGVFASLLLFVMVLFVMWQCFKTLKYCRMKFNVGISAGALMASIGMLMHSTVDFVLQNYAISILFITILCIPFILKNIAVTNENNQGRAYET